MKLIIDISDDFYNVLTDSQYDKIRNIKLEHLDLVQKIKNGISLEKELENIKTEIEPLPITDTAIRLVAKVIDDHISELKGE